VSLSAIPERDPVLRPVTGVKIMGSRAECWKPQVEILWNQEVVERLKGLLAADWL